MTRNFRKHPTATESAPAFTQAPTITPVAMPSNSVTATPTATINTTGTSNAIMTISLARSEHDGSDSAQIQTHPGFNKTTALTPSTSVLAAPSIDDFTPPLAPTPFKSANAIRDLVSQSAELTMWNPISKSDKVKKSKYFKI
jgi:hypothetical protein